MVLVEGGQKNRHISNLCCKSFSDFRVKGCTWLARHGKIQGAGFANCNSYKIWARVNIEESSAIFSMDIGLEDYVLVPATVLRTVLMKDTRPLGRPEISTIAHPRRFDVYINMYV